MRIGPIIIAIAVAAATLWRWPRLGWPVRGLGVAVCVALAVYGVGIIHLPQLEDIISSVGSTLGVYTYALVAVMAFLETGAFVGLLVPGETVVIVGGVVAGQGHIDLGLVLGLTWLCAFAGDVTGYLLGRRLGRRFLVAHGPRVHITEQRLLRVEAFFGRYGPATILIGRFIGMVRAVAPFLAGASKYSLGRFVALAALGTGMWSATFVVLGYLFWQSLDEAIAIAKQGSLALGTIVVLVIALVTSYRYLRDKASGEGSLKSPRRSTPARPDRARSEGSFPQASRGRRRARSESTVGLKVGSEDSS
jgi:membrane protein DedA with SNARE-associated domain